MSLFSFIEDKLAGKVATSDEIRQRLVASGYPIKNLMIVSDASSGQHVAVIYGFVPDQATREKIVVEVGGMAGIQQVEDRMTIGEPAPTPVARIATTRSSRSVRRGPPTTE